MKTWLRHWFLLFVLALGFPFFFVGGPGYYATRSFKSAWDLGHIFFFTLVSVVLCDLFSRRTLSSKPFYVFLRVFVVIFLLGLTVELLQMFSDGRSPNLFDLLRDMLGALIGCVFFCAARKMVPPLFLKGMQTGTLLLVLSFLWPLARAVFDERMAVAQFPLLSNFETPFETVRWREAQQLQRVATPVRHGKRSMRVQLSIRKYSGTNLFYFPPDWSGYKWLNFSVYNPYENTFTLHGRIHDQRHKSNNNIFADRFHAQFVLCPGWNDLQISLAAVRSSPAGREMNMHKIEGFGIFVVSQESPRVMYLDHIYLSL